MNTIESLPIYITRQDNLLLFEMIENLKHDPINNGRLASLENSLKKAITVEDRHMLRNVVTMNSRVAIIDKETSERRVITLVFPQDADSEKNKISIISPFGSAILGHRTGDEFEQSVESKTRRFVIEKVIYQPEDQKLSHTKFPAYARP